VDKATLSVWTSRTARASTASSKKTSCTPFAILFEWSQVPTGVLVIGADRTGQLLEVVVLDDDVDDEPIVIHAMPLRPKFHPYLR
jgi:hypothetical protein